jgi:dTDP-glucose 4,6-dehydratase
VYGDGKNVRDWIHVEDHCAGLVAALERGTPGQVYNLGAATEKANIDVVHAVLDLVGKPRALVKYVKDRPGHDRRYAIDPAKSTRELGWSASRGFDEALAATVAWYRENRGWWERIISGEYMRYYEKQYGARA